MASTVPAVSVVINTLNRAESLRRTLIALRYQRYPNFEVVVVEGPSNEPADGVVAEFAGAVRYLSCPDANLSRSRNIGIEAAAGEIVAFIDDDAVPQTYWLEQLVAAYGDPRVAGAGGIVFDHTGTRVQYRYSCSDRVGRTMFSQEPYAEDEVLPGAEIFPYLQGTNMSFLRARLVEVEGFDEEIEYNFDEVEVCLRMVDRGYLLRSLDTAYVFHKYLPSHVRNIDRVFTDPFLPIKNRVYFALRHGRLTRAIDEVLVSLHEYLDEVRRSASDTHRSGRLDQQQLDFFLSRLDEGFEVGLLAGMAGERQSPTLGPADVAAYRRYARLEPTGKRLTACFLSQEYPPGDFGGVGRYTAELARGFADEGHEVHVFTRAVDEVSTVDFEAGCWVRRVPAIDKRVPELASSPAAGNLYLLAANYHEVRRLHETSPVDVVSAPLWLCEGLCCSLDDELRTVTTLVTTMKTIADLHPSWRDGVHPQAMLRLERETIGRSSGLHAISQAILEQVSRDYPSATLLPSFVIPLGVEDRATFEPKRSDSRDNGLTVLFVGRLEVRKGVDVLLDSALRLMRELPEVKFVIAGKDTPNTERGETYREGFERSVVDRPDLLRRVRFLGPVDEDELWRLYAECDVFCAPSRFESFGLVLVEAMMFGKPVVACDTGGMTEIVVPEETGLLAMPGDVDSLTACLRRMLTDDELRGRCATAARSRYLATYELRGVIERTVDGYRAFATSRVGGITGGRHERMVADFGQTIAEVAEIPVEQAMLAADRLLDASAYPVDVRLAVKQAWAQPPPEFVRAVFQALLQRAAHDGEVDFWIRAAGEPGWRMNVVEAISTSPEAQSLGLVLDWFDAFRRAGGPVRDHRQLATAIERLAGTDDARYVEALYQAFLGRSADPPGWARWTEMLGRGISRRDVAISIAASAEAHLNGVFARRLQIALGDPGPDAALRRSWSLPDKDFLRLAYSGILDREADPGGLRGHCAALAAGRSRLQVISDLARSEEGMEVGDTDWFERLAADPPSMATSPNTGRAAVQAAVQRVGTLARRGREYLGSVRRLPRAVRAQGDAVVGLAQGLTALAEGQSDLGGGLREAREELQRLARADARLRVVAQDQRSSDTRQRSLDRQAVRELGMRLSEATGQLAGLEATVDVLRRKQETVSLDLRERLGQDTQPEEIMAPYAIDPGQLARRIREIGSVRLNLGCGEKPLDGYVNVDFRKVPNVDIVADVRRLPFSPGEVEEIASSHLIEHFRQHQLRLIILPYWRDLLAEGGVLRITCPNWQKMLERVQTGELTFADFKTVTFGLQDYDGDDHFAMYSPQTLADVLREAGFDGIEVIDAERRNGMSTEMELTAVKTGRGRSDGASSDDGAALQAAEPEQPAAHLQNR